LQFQVFPRRALSSLHTCWVPPLVATQCMIIYPFFECFHLGTHRPTPHHFSSALPFCSNLWFSRILHFPVQPVGEPLPTGPPPLRPMNLARHHGRFPPPFCPTELRHNKRGPTPKKTTIGHLRFNENLPPSVNFSLVHPGSLRRLLSPPQHTSPPVYTTNRRLFHPNLVAPSLGASENV